MVGFFFSFAGLREHLFNWLMLLCFEVLRAVGDDGNRGDSAESCSAHEVEFAGWSHVQHADCEPGVLFVTSSSGHGRVLL